MIYNVTDVAAIYLLLGPACNMSCRHCSQTPIKDTFSLKPSVELDERVVAFLQNWLKQKGNHASRIYFWGGEPLLYWETIKKTILMFESRKIYPERYIIFSNGLLLNDEIVEFCNSHKIQFTMSYDAPYPLAVRNKKPSAENIKCFLKIKKRIANSVFSALNHNLVEAYNVLEDVFPETIVTMGVINVLSNIPKDIYTFDDGQIKFEIDRLADEVLAGNDPYGNRYNLFVKHFIAYDTFHIERFTEAPFPPCSPSRISLSFRFNGDIILCHNDYRVVANVVDSYDEIVANHLKYWQDFLPEKCYKCDVLPICRNRCPIGVFTEDKTEYIHCDLLRQFYGAIMSNRERLTEGEVIKPYKDLRLGVKR